jgi:hypothetical protein
MRILTDKDEQTKFEFEHLKLVYEQSAETHRHYTTWREKLLVGLFVVVSILFLSTYKLYTDNNGELKIYGAIVSFLVPVTCLIFSWLDSRNRELYLSAQRTGIEIEKKLFESLNKDKANTLGLFFDLNKSWRFDDKGVKFKWADNVDKDTRAHTWTFRVIYGVLSILGLVTTILILKNS